MSEREAIDLILETLEEGFEVSVRWQLTPTPKKGLALLKEEFIDMLVPGNEETSAYQGRRQAEREDIKRRYEELQILLSERLGNAAGVIDALRKRYPRFNQMFKDILRVAQKRGRFGSGDAMYDDAFLAGYYIGFFKTLKIFL